MIRIITDGACSGNPGPGGWAAIIIRDGEVEELGGYEPQTTNNRMEMRAAIEGLRRVPADAPVHIVSDSTYLIKGMTQWLRAWKARGWVTAAGTPVLNQDLWEELDRLVGTRVTWELVKGHSGHPENERADTIAQAFSQGKTPPAHCPPPAAAPAPSQTRSR
ncbi:MAG TPA: ribonuclease HI, partial [Armatimonadetes bacterium]|nr:ribonuclease HI [Armatimonadota bacterium]